MRTQLLVLAASALAAFGCRPLPALSADLTPGDIFARHEAAVGYSLSDGKAKPYSMTLTSTSQDALKHADVAVLTRKQAGPYYWVDERYAGSRFRAYGFSDIGFWDASPNDNVTTRTGYSRSFAVTSAIIDAEAYGDSLKPEIRGSKGDDEIVRIHPKDGVDADVYFNRNTWFVDQTILDPDFVAARETYTDYQQQGPVWIAMSRTIGPTTMRVTSFQWDASLTNDDLAPPRPRQYATFPASGSTTVPFDWHGGVIVEASVNGVTGRFAVNPVVNGIIIDSVMGIRTHLIQPGYQTQVYLTDRLLELEAIQKATVQVGGLKLQDVNVKIWSDNFGEDLYGRMPFDGALGLDVLAQAVTSIDFDAHTVTFTDPSRFVPDPAQAAVPLQLDEGGAHITAEANKATPVSLWLDLAAPWHLGLFTEFARENPSVAGAHLYSRSSVGALSIGPFLFNDVGALSMGTNNSGDDYSSAEGALGLPVLDTLDMTFDYPAQTVFLRPTKGST